MKSATKALFTKTTMREGLLSPQCQFTTVQASFTVSEILFFNDTFLLMLMLMLLMLMLLMLIFMLMLILVCFCW